LNLPLPKLSFKPAKHNSAWIVLALMAVQTSLACGSSPAATVAATAPPTAAPTDDPNPPPDGWNLVLREQFDKDGEWGIATDSGHDVTAIVSDGALDWTLSTKDASSYRDPDLNAPLSDFMMSVNVHLVRGDGTYGVTFRAQDEGEYAFKVTYGGQYSLQFGDNSGWTKLTDWTETGVEGDSVPRRIAVRAEGDHFTMYVNDQQVGEFSDSRLKKGTVGLIVSTFDDSSITEVKFDNLTIYAP